MNRTRLRTRLSALARTPRLLLAQKLLRRVPLRPVDIGQLCFLQLNGVPRVPAAMRRGHADVRLATADDIPAMARLQNKAAMFRDRLAQGDRCVVALVDGTIVGYEWFSENTFHLEAAWGYRITIPGGFVYAYDAFIDPAYRNTGVWLRFKAYLAEWMAATGKQGVLTFVDYGNWPSLRTHLRFGFQPTESIVALRVIGMRLFRKARAVGVTTWSYLVWVLACPATGPLHHASARALHVVLTIVRR
jgi:GNAT superfamily N-acetyltransferase